MVGIRSFGGEGAPRALVLNGARAGDGATDALAAALAGELDRAGLDAHAVTLREVAIAPCLGCFECWTKTPGTCRTHDGGREVAEAFAGARLVVAVTPITFGGYSSELKKAVDRLLCVVLPFFVRTGDETHHAVRYARSPAFLAIGVVATHAPEEERIFHELVRRNAVNFRAPAFASHVALRSAAGDGATAELRGMIAGVLDASRPVEPGLALGGGAR